MHVSRRQFLGQAAKAGAGIAIVGIWGCERTEWTAPVAVKRPLFLTPDSEAFVLSHGEQAPIDESQWRLDIYANQGLRHRFTIRQLRDLQAEKGIDALASVVCVFDSPEQDMAYNGFFRGLALADVIGEVSPHVKRIHIHGADGFHSSLPVSVLQESAHRVTPMLATAFQGVSLSHERGFPIRLIAPGFYAYKHIKYVTAITLSDEPEATGDFESMFRSDPDRPMSSFSKIQEPFDTAIVQAGRLTIIGYALPSDSPITRVDVQVDQGPWQTAHLVSQEQLLAEVELLGTARQHAWPYPYHGVWAPWVFQWQASAGAHSISVRTHTADAKNMAETSYLGTPGQTIHVQVMD